MPINQLLIQMFVSSRPISWINTAFPFAAGYLASGGTLNTYFFAATLYFLIPYNMLIYIVNDVFDYESDIKNPRKNSIEGGILPPSTHAFMLTATAAVNVIFLDYLILFGTTVSSLVLLLLIFAAVSYSAPPLRLKERPVLDSINSSVHFVGPLAMALVVTGWENAYVPYVAAFFFWGCASHAFGAVQDIIPDRKAGIASIATHFGASNTVKISVALYVLSGACVTMAGWPAVILLIPLFLYIWMVLPYVSLRDSESQQANKGWKKFLALNQVSGFSATIVLLLDSLGHL